MNWSKIDWGKLDIPDDTPITEVPRLLPSDVWRKIWPDLLRLQVKVAGGPDSNTVVLSFLDRRRREGHEWFARDAGKLLTEALERGDDELKAGIIAVLLGKLPRPRARRSLKPSERLVGLAVADYYEEHDGRLPGTQRELESYLRKRGMRTAQRTVNDALKALGLRELIRGKQGRLPKNSSRGSR